MSLPSVMKTAMWLLNMHMMHGAIVGTLIGIAIEELFQLVKEDIVNWIDKTIDEIVCGSKMERGVYA